MVTNGALRCPSCSVHTPGEEGVCGLGAFALLPDGFNPNKVDPQEVEEEGASVSAGTGDVSGLHTPHQGISNELFLLHAFGAGLETAREDETDERPAVWCHQKSCRNDSDTKGLLICSKCRRCFHAG